MKKGLRGFLIAVAAIFGLLIVMAVLGNTVFSNAESKKELTQTPTTVGKTATAPSPTASRTATKGSELLIRLNDSGTIGGLLFEDGTYIAVDSTGGLYKRISINKEGKCFAFSTGYDSSRTTTVELKPGMVVFYEVREGGYYFYIYREHAMNGIPIILLPDKWSIDHPDGYEVTVRSEDSGIDFAFSGKSGRDKIVKIPVAGAKSIVSTRNGDGYMETVTDSFDNPVPVKATEPYSIVEIESSILENSWVYKWQIVPPVMQKDEVKLSDSTIAKILSLRP